MIRCLDLARRSDKAAWSEAVYGQLREKYADRVNEKSVLREDTLFSSPSAAAGFVTYASANGLIMWSTGDGRTLRDMESAD